MEAGDGLVLSGSRYPIGQETIELRATTAAPILANADVVGSDENAAGAERDAAGPRNSGLNDAPAR
jgi:hypothetical protein